jgi:hypothetical protein
VIFIKFAVTPLQKVYKKFFPNSKIGGGQEGQANTGTFAMVLMLVVVCVVLIFPNDVIPVLAHGIDILTGKVHTNTVPGIDSYVTD